ncbi:MAG: riboflavin synthase [Aquificae bacterium]|nr:riboflavin synthase [Aquificota bacterium]
MFTGLVEALGEVVSLSLSPSNSRLRVRAPLEGVRVGDSVAVNGACLTAVEVSGDGLTFDLSRETLERTNLRFLKPGDEVNLERALTLNKPLGGHLVLGHVDTVGRIEVLRPVGEHHLLRVSFDERFSPFVVEKGSIAVDGISLTVNRVGPNWVEINVVPHTFRSTNLRRRRAGDLVNLEFDLFGKYAVRYLERVFGKERRLLEFLSDLRPFGGL